MSALRQIYCIAQEDGSAFKFGIGRDARKRLESFQTGNPNKLVLVAVRYGTEFDEAEIHAALASVRIRGEWFLPGETLARVFAQYFPEALEDLKEWEKVIDIWMGRRAYVS